MIGTILSTSEMGKQAVLCRHWVLWW